MKILIVHNYYQIAGGEDTVVANERQMLTENGHEVFMYTRDNSELKTMSGIAKAGLPFTTIFNPRTVRDVRKIIRKEHIDIVHVHNTLNLVSAAVYYVALSCNVPVVQTIHNYRLLCPKATLYRDGAICEKCISNGLLCSVKGRCYRDSLSQTLVCAVATKIHRITGIYGRINYICLTEFGKNKLLSINDYYGNKNKKLIKDDSVFVKSNFMAGGSEKIVPLKEREPIIVYAGRLDETKGVDMLLRSWSRLQKESIKNGPLNVKLVVCGEGPLEEWCQNYIVSNGLENVHMAGKVSHEEVIELLKRAMCMVLPTKWYEGFPMSIAESYSVGTPVVGPDMGNVGCIIEDGVSGIKYAQDDEENLAKALSVFAKGNGTEHYYDGAFRLYSDYYNQAANYETLMGIYRTVSGKD